MFIALIKHTIILISPTFFALVSVFQRTLTLFSFSRAIFFVISSSDEENCSKQNHHFRVYFRLSFKAFIEWENCIEINFMLRKLSANTISSAINSPHERKIIFRSVLLTTTMKNDFPTLMCSIFLFWRFLSCLVLIIRIHRLLMLVTG